MGSLSLNGGSIADLAGNTATLTLQNVGSTTSVLVNAVAPQITTPPVTSSAICIGTAVNVSVQASGPSLTYQWIKDGQTPVSSSTTLQIASAQATDQGSYVVVVSNSCASLTSTAFALTVYNPAKPDLATISGQSYPASQTAITITQNSQVNRLSMPIGQGQGILLLQVSTPTQRQNVKLFRP